MYLIESSSPFDPGARPSNSSEDNILICASNPSGVIASSAQRVYFIAQPHSRLSIEIPFRCALENRCHVRRNRIRPSVSIVAGVIAVQMAEIRHERRAWVDWQKNFLQNRIRNRHAIIRSILRVWSVQREIKRSKGELPSIEYARGREFGVFHFLNGFIRNFL